MRIVEILLPRGAADRSLSPHAIKKIDALQRRMTAYADKICNPSTTPAGREFLRTKLKTDYDELRDTLREVSVVSEAVHRLPLSNEDFELVKALFDNPIPAAVASIYIESFIIDDELNDQIESISETEPARDIRPLLVEWFDRVMPDQMHRFTGQHRTYEQEKGILSPIHGYDPHYYKGSNDPITGNAYGRF